MREQTALVATTQEAEEDKEEEVEGGIVERAPPAAAANPSPPCACLPATRSSTPIASPLRIRDATTQMSLPAAFSPKQPYSRGTGYSPRVKHTPVGDDYREASVARLESNSVHPSIVAIFSKYRDAGPHTHRRPTPPPSRDATSDLVRDEGSLVEEGDLPAAEVAVVVSAPVETCGVRLGPGKPAPPCHSRAPSQDRDLPFPLQEEDGRVAVLLHRVAGLQAVYRAFDLDCNGDVGEEELLELGKARRALGQKQGEWTPAMNARVLMEIGADNAGHVSMEARHVYVERAVTMEYYINYLC